MFYWVFASNAIMAVESMRRPREITNNYRRLEERRKVKGAAYYERKKAARRQLLEAQKNAQVDDKTKKQLAEYGY